MLYFVLGVVFLIGAALGSFLNVVAARLPYEKSLLWPGSRCGSCLQPVRWYDNIPLFSYWILRGRCRDCGTSFSVRYFLVELATAVCFVGLFHLVVVHNVLRLPLIDRELANIQAGLIAPIVYVVFAWPTTLFCFLLAASLCDLEHMEIPLPLTVTGTLIGLVGSACFAWPYPEMPPVKMDTPGLYPWPVWHQLPPWLPPGSWQLGLATGFAGAAAGMIVLRTIRFLFGMGRGIEGLGVGDADLMMMAGSFLGWQIVLVAFFVSVFPALFLGIGQLILRGDQAMPFGPSLSLGVLLTLFFWPVLGGHFRPLFAMGNLLIIMAGIGAVLLLVISFMLRLIRGTPTD